MPTYKLTYFEARGRAEIARFIFKQADVDFEDVRLKKEEWPAFKPTTPYGSMPVLEVDGKMLAGSRSIQRYLAEEFGLAGTNAFENAELDSIIDIGVDVSTQLATIFPEKDETRKAEALKKFEEETGPKHLGVFEKLISDNSGTWLYGSKVTYVDFALYNIMAWIKLVAPKLAENFPGITANMEAVETLPNIAKWLKERPESQF